MIATTEIARGIHRLAFWDEPDLVSAGLVPPGTTINLYLIAADRPALIHTGLRRAFRRVQDHIRAIVDPAKLSYVVVPHHEGDSSGAINLWLDAAPRAVALCSDLCASLSLRDFADKEPRVVADEEIVDLGSHRLRFFMTPQVNQWDSLMVYEEVTQTLFPNDLFSSMGTDITTAHDHSTVALSAARDLGYQPDDRRHLIHALDKISSLDIKVIATMHGPAVTAHIDTLIGTFRDNSLST
jgi:flavorubredoxin